MAKVRRIVRTVRPERPQGFDEQLWPVDVALIVLGGFLIGVDLAYLRFDDPRWYANAIVWLVATPVLVLGTMGALRLVSSRMVRRSMQLAMVVSVVVHVLFLVSMINIVIFSRMWPDVIQTTEVTPRQPKVIPDYHPVYSNPEPKQQPDFEKPIETKTPEVEEKEVVQKQETPETPQPDRPQPTPVPEPEQTVQPSVVKRQEASESVPRHAEQTSKLSRQTNKVQPRPNQPVAVPQLASSAASAAAASPAASQVQRQTTQSQPQRRPAEAEPTTDIRQQQVQLSRRQPEARPQADSTAAPTMPRQQAQPQLTPRTQVNAADTSAVAKQTDPAQLTPRNTEATRQTTASPEVARRATEPVPETPTQTAARPQRRQLDAPPTPQVAQTPVPLPASRSRTTTRPDPTPASPTVANNAQPSPTPQPTATPQPQSTSVERSVPTTVAQRRATPAPPQPDATPVDRPSTQRASRSEAAPQVTTTPAATAVARSASRATATAPSQARAEQSAAATREALTGEVSPTSVATQKQNVAQPQVAQRSAEPAPATSRRPPTSATARAVERASGQSSVPSVVPNATPTVARSATARATPPSQVSAESVAATKAPAQSDNPQPSRQASQVARAPAQSSQANPTSRPLDVPSLSPTAQAAGATAVRRSESSAVPTLDPQGRPSPQPARAVRSAAVAASPTAVESPAVAQSAQPSGGPSVQPAQTVLNRSRSGVAGIGEARNMDRAKPADETPTAMASAAATRREATQQAQEGPALSPSSPALVRRNRADAPRPSATLRAQPVELATAAGSDQPSELSATSSAALVEAASNASSGPVSAAAGSVDVDLGPSRVVSEGGAGRAAGGGQPQLSSSNEPPQLTRSGTGAAARVALAVPQAAPVAAAPDGTGGGRPAPTELDPAATAAVRTDAGGDVPISGGPSPANQTGPAAEASTAELVGSVQLQRADSAELAAGGEPSAATSVPELDEEEERARQLARSATGGAPKLAMAGPVIQAVPAAAAAEMKGPADAPAIAASEAAGNMERTAETGGTPVAAAPAAQAVAAEGMVQPAESSAAGDLLAANQMRRAEAVDAAAGPVETGGGSGSPTRSAVGPKFVANSRAEVISLAGAPQSAGTPAGAPLEAQGVEQARLAGGAVAPSGSDPVGAAAGPQVMDVALDAAPGTVAGSRRASPDDEDGPSLGDAGPRGAPLPRAESVAMAGGPPTVAQIVLPQAAGAGAEAMPDMGDLAAGMDGVGPMSRQATAGLAVNMDAVEGPGGLGQEYATDVGINNRRAREDSLQVQATPARFARQQVGGTPDFNTAAVVAAQPFQGRMARRPGDTSGGTPGSAGPQTEESIERGLAFLARYQRGDGSWTLKGFGEEVALASDTAATGLALLAFQGAGYTHKEYRYADTVRGGVEFLVKNQKEDGDLFVPLDDDSNRSVWLYSHGIAAIALCEAYGMTQDPDLREPAQKAIDFIVASQHKDRGAWRYSPNVGSDTSVTGWMMMALKSGELANLDVPKDCYQKIDKWLDLSQASSRDRHLYRYNPYAPDTLTQRHGREASTTMTAVGLLMRLYSGWRRDNTAIVRGADYLKENLPAIGTPRDPQRDTYYWYYATQVMFHMGGEHWEAWHGQLHPLLVDQQLQQGPFAGSWEPRGPVPDRWAPHAGRLYVTTMNLLSLEVSYRHLPLYEDTGK
jgi:hypothetical protein